MPKRRSVNQTNMKVHTSRSRHFRSLFASISKAPASAQFILFDITSYSLVAFCFFLSGLAALIYQMAWLRSLSIVFGTSHLSVATVLAAYMGGLAAGSWLAAKFADRVRRPVFAYGLLELVIAGSAVLVPAMLALSQKLLVEVIGQQPDPPDASGISQALFYLVSAFVILGIPTTAMGATLPMLAKDVVHSDREIGPRIGQLYGMNTFGAVAGALVGGFLLLPYIGLKSALLTGAGINLIVFGLVVILLRRERSEQQGNINEISKSRLEARTEKNFHPIMALVFLSGAVSFGLEVLWTRLLSHIFGGTIYAFAIMLASFLTGIALGSLLAGNFARSRKSAQYGFVLAQICIGLASLGSFTVVGLYVPEFSSLWVRSLYAFTVIVPGTVFIGATIPLAVHIASQGSHEIAVTVGRIYAMNTLGAIVGSLVSGFFLLPMLGIVDFLRLLVATSFVISFVALGFSEEKISNVYKLVAPALLASLIFFLPQRPDRVLYSHLEDVAESGIERYFAVGISSTVLLREENGFAFLSTDGLAESIIPRKGMPPIRSSQSWLSALPMLARPEAKEMLVVGFGGGQVIEGVPPGIEKIDVIELEPEVIEANRAFTSERAFNPFEDHRVQIVRNDARNAMILTNRRYDAIVSQPSHPWTAGASHLYTREFLSLARNHLQDDGVLLQWINLEFVDEGLLRSFVGTILSEFKHAELYQPEPRVLLFVASDRPIDIVGRDKGVERALAKDAAHYRRLGMRSKEDIAVMLVLNEEGLKAFANGSQPNGDDLNRLAFHSRWRGDGLSLQSAQELFSLGDPLLDSNSVLRGWLSEESLPYVSDRLLQSGQIDRACNLPRTIMRKAVRMTVAGLCFARLGRLGEARRVLFAALATEPNYEPARLALLMTHLSDFARGQLSREIAIEANRLTGPHRRIFEGWIFGAMGDFDRLKLLDDELAQVGPTSLGYPAAGKLRVDWRIAMSARSGDRALAVESLEMLDGLLSTFTNPELYQLRAAAAHYSDNRPALYETTGLILRYLRELELRPSQSNENEVKRIKQNLAIIGDWISSNGVHHTDERAKYLTKRIEEIASKNKF